MSLKKLINSPYNCVDECLYGLTESFPALIFHAEERAVFNGIPNKRRKVAILSGGGSGHEPFPSGYVGEGMLTGSVSGSIFTSPPKRNILHAIKILAENHEGVFIIVPNYTGDRLNFGLALEAARKQGIQVKSVIVGDDIAQEAYGIESKCGRRGICGLITVLKVAGYLAKEGESLDTIENITESVIENLASIGASIEPCSIPGSGPLFQLTSDQMELGIGVHGEAGVCKMSLKSAQETVEILLKHLIEYLKVRENDELVAVINNLGTLSQMEQWIVAGEVEKQLSLKQVKLIRIYVGPLFTSLNMAGVQISLLKLAPICKELVLNALDDPTTAPAWPGSFLSSTKTAVTCVAQVKPNESMSFSGDLLSDSEEQLVERCLMVGSNAVIDNTEKINYLDSGCGDGDCGSTAARLAKEILKRVQERTLAVSRPEELLNQLGDIAEGTMGGTSGAIYALFFLGASTSFSNNASIRDPEVWAKAWSMGISFIKKYSTARIGDRTLLDALELGCETFHKSLEKDCCPRKAILLAANSAQEGCSNTKNMKAAVGRASYVNSAALKEVDAGAFTICLWLTAFCSVLNDSLSPQDNQ